MASVFRGTTSSTAEYIIQSLPQRIVSLSVNANSSDNPTTFTCYVVPVGGGSAIAITPLDKNITASSHNDDVVRLLKVGDTIRVSANASVAFYITIENIES